MQQRSGKRTFLAAFGAAVLGCAFSFGAQAADSYPSKPITLIVNFPAGGATDVLARAVAAPLSVALGQSVVVENKGGANGNIGGEDAVRAKPDGYTLLMSSGSMVSINPLIYRHMPFDPAKDLEPIAAAALIKVFLVTKPGGKMPADYKSFVAYLKAHPGETSYGTPGNGSSPHLATELFQKMAGVSSTHVPYRGAAPALVDLLAGHIDFVFDPGIAMQYVKSGKLNLLAVGSMTRSPVFPDVPTLDELGLKGFDADSIFGFYAPAGTPKEIITKLNAAINKVIGTPEFQKQVVEMGGVAAPMTPQQFHERAAEDAVRFGGIVKERKIVVD